MDQYEYKAVLVLLDNIYAKLERKNRQVFSLDIYENLTLAEVKTVFAIGNSGGKTMKDISRALGVAPNTATVAVDRLVIKELALRKSGSEDRRNQIIELTKKGIDIMKQIDNEMIQEIMNFLSPLSDAELLLFKNLLEKIDKKL